MLFDQLSAKTYDAQEAVQWTKDIADLIREKVKGEIHSSKIDEVRIRIHFA